MFWRVLMFIIMAFLGLIGISVNFRKNDSHNPFILSFWGYVFFAIGFIGFGLAVMFQVNDYKETLDAQQNLTLQHFQDSIKREYDKREMIGRIRSQQLSIDTLSVKLDEKDSINIALMKQNINLIGLSSSIQKDEQGVLFQNKGLLTKISDFQEQVVQKDKRIDYLQKSVSATKRGMYKSISFTGIVSTGNSGGGSSGFGILLGSKEEEFYKNLDSAVKAQDIQKILYLSNEGIKMFPDWMTPYYFKGIALASLGKINEAKQLMLLVEENTTGDPDYTQVLMRFYQVLNDDVKIKQLSADYLGLH